MLKGRKVNGEVKEREREKAAGHSNIRVPPRVRGDKQGLGGYKTQPEITSGWMPRRRLRLWRERQPSRPSRPHTRLHSAAPSARTAAESFAEYCGDLPGTQTKQMIMHCFMIFFLSISLNFIFTMLIRGEEKANDNALFFFPHCIIQ